MQQLAVEAGGHEFALTASAGVASFPDDGRTVEELVAKAATTMYTARAGGKGRIAFYSGPSRVHGGRGLGDKLLNGAPVVCEAGDTRRGGEGELVPACLHGKLLHG